MKKLGLLFAATVFAASASAQTVAESKTFDNIYIGINGGVATKTTGHKWLSDLNPNAGLRIGRYFTPVFGLAIEGNAYFSNKTLEINRNYRSLHQYTVVGYCKLQQLVWWLQR